MDFRDEVALKILMNILKTSQGMWDKDFIKKAADKAYDFADAMIERRDNYE